MKISKTFSNREIPLLKSCTDFNPFRYRIPVILTSIVFIIAFSFIHLSLSTFISYILFGVIGLYISAYFGRKAIKLFTLVYAISTISAVSFYYIFLIQYKIPYGGGGSDSLGYENLAALLRNSNLRYNSEEIGLIIDLPYHNSKGYIYLINLFIRFGDFFGGFHTMIPRLFNCNLLGISSVIIYSICKKISLPINQALKSGLVTGLFPIMIYVSVQSLRDTPIVCILIISVSLSISIIKTKGIPKRILYTLLFVPLAFILMEFRLLNIINLFLMLIVGWFVYLFSIKRLSNFYIVSIIAGFVIVYNSLTFIDIPLAINLISKLDSSSLDLAEGVDRSVEGVRSVGQRRQNTKPVDQPTQKLGSVSKTSEDERKDPGPSLSSVEKHSLQDGEPSSDESTASARTRGGARSGSKPRPKLTRVK